MTQEIETTNKRQGHIEQVCSHTVDKYAAVNEKHQKNPSAIQPCIMESYSSGSSSIVKQQKQHSEVSDKAAQ